MVKTTLHRLVYGISLLLLSVAPVQTGAISFAKKRVMPQQPGIYAPLFELVPLQGIEEPASLLELQVLVQHASARGEKISIVGADKSQGGQTMSNAACARRVSLRRLNKLVYLDVAAQEVTVQAGMCWSQLQEHIAPHGLAVKAMQSYHNFSIGGSLGVNVHGQDVRENPLIKTVKSFKIMLASGEVIVVSRSQQAELFKAAIGGYGLFGIIVEVTLALTDDVVLVRKVKAIRAKNLANYVRTHIQPNAAIEFYSARFSIGKSDLLQKALVITYERADQQDGSYFSLQRANGMTKVQDFAVRNLMGGMQKFDPLKDLRFGLEMFCLSGAARISRNNFMSASLNGLPHDTATSQYILQEYFIPYDRLNEFLDYLRLVVRDFNVNLLNLTARHVNKDNESYLTYAPAADACALVLYLNVARTPQAQANTVYWTRKLIDKALACKGVYYLPYQLIGTKTQIRAAYPTLQNFIALKQAVDPQLLFTNRLYECFTA